MTDFWRHLDAWWNLYSVCSHLYTQLYTEREREADGRRRKREREGGREEFLAISSQRPPECLHPPKSICWIPYPKSNGIWRWGLWEVTGFTWSQGGRAPTMGMLLPHDPFPPREDAASGCKPGRGHSPKTWPCWYPDLRPPASRTEIKRVGCLSCPVCGILLEQPEQTNRGATQPPPASSYFSELSSHSEASPQVEVSSCREDGVRVGR